MISKETIIKGTTYYYDNKNNHQIMSAIFAIGNMFKLTITEEQKNSEFIHAYAMASSESEGHKFGFLLVSSNDDTVSDFSNYEDYSGNYVYEPIGKGNFTVADNATGYNSAENNNPDQITRKEAEERISRWNNWIGTSESKGIFRAFIIPTIDVEFDVEHQCFLALRDDKGELIADLLVVNFNTNEIVSHNISKRTENIEDMVRPVPPFKPSVASSYENFGIFKSIWPSPKEL